MSSTSIELSNQSCFDFLKNLPNNSVDLFLIDPPYEVSRDTNFQSGELKGDNTDRFRVSMDFGDWDSGFTGLDTVISEAYRVLRKGGTLICFYDLWKLTTLKEYLEKAKFKQLRFIEWLKTNPVPLNSKTNYLTNAREIAILGVKGGRPTFHSEYDNGIYKYPICHDKGRFHPTQKPLALIEELIKKHSEEGDVVVDCFSGSGTTAVTTNTAFDMLPDKKAAETLNEAYVFAISTTSRSITAFKAYRKTRDEKIKKEIQENYLLTALSIIAFMNEDDFMDFLKLVEIRYNKRILNRLQKKGWLPSVSYILQNAKETEKEDFALS